MEHLPGCRPAEALAKVKDVGDYNNREDRGLRRNKREHSHTPTRRKFPGRFSCGYRCTNRAHPIASRRFRFKKTQRPKKSFAVFPVRILGMFYVPQRPAAP